MTQAPMSDGDLPTDTLAATVGALHRILGPQRAEPLMACLPQQAPFLQLTLEREAAFLAQALPAHGIRGTVLRLLWSLTQPQESLSQLMTHLRVQRRRLALLIALEDLAGVVPFPQTLAHLSMAGGRAVRAALRGALEELGRRGSFDIPSDHRDPGRRCGLVAYGMGKMGAMELNYSSDVDLVLVYEPRMVPTRRPDRLEEDMDRLARLMVRILEEATGDGYAFRMDLRLRPDPGSTPACVSADFARTYYATRGQNWERAAFIRARPVAGDMRVAASLRPMFSAWIWRRQLDFAAIRDIQSIKRQIHAHKGHGQFTLLGHDIKVGAGGIREIELLTQTLQLIWGGRRPAVRRRRTTDALEALTQAGVMEAQTAEALSQAYLGLRRLEHRLQMQEDRQTHRLPDTAEALRAFAPFTPQGSLEALQAWLEQTHRTVSAAHAQLFGHAPSLSVDQGSLVFTGVEDDPETLETLSRLGYSEPGTVSTMVRGWHYGRYPGLRHESARQSLTEITPTLLTAFAATAQPMQALARLDGMLRQSSSATRMLSLLVNQPQVTGQLAHLLCVSPFLAERLAVAPHLLDVLCEPHSNQSLSVPPEELAEDAGERVGSDPDLDQAMDRLRVWVKEQQVVTGLAVLGDASPLRVGRHLSSVADVALTRLQAEVERDFAQKFGRVPDGGLSLILMGTFGGQEATLSSDVDIVLAYAQGQGDSDGPQSLDATTYFGRLARRFMNAATAMTAEGRLYELDARLRPAGQDGPLASSFRGLLRYWANEAWTWERMALTRARVISGPLMLQEGLRAGILAVLTTPRDPTQTLDDIWSMRQRTHEHKKLRGPWDIKRRRGGLMDLEFIVQAMQLVHAPEDPGVLRVGTADALAALKARAFIEADAAAELTQALGLFQLIRQRQALLAEGAMSDPNQLRQPDPDNGPPVTGELDYRLDLPHLTATCGRVRHHLAQTFGQPLDPDDA